MKLLVTGGAGFIGSNFIRYWLKRYPEDKIINLDKLTYAGHLSSTKDIAASNNYRFIKGDICNNDLVNRIVGKVDCVVHFAAESHVDRSILDPALFVKTKVLGTHTLLEAALKANVKRFHNISTDEVYGDLPLNTKKKFTLESCYNPSSPYSASKAASDFLVRSYYHTYGLKITITNTSNNFGPYQDPEKFLPRIITNLIDGVKIPIYGKGKNIRDWLYVEDHCRAIDFIIKKGNIGETYLVGGLKNDISNLEVAKKLLYIFGYDKSYIRFVKDRVGHDRKYAVDWSKINKDLEWKPKFDFDIWLQRTVDWYKQNEW